MQQQLDQAQQKLGTDQQSWQDTHIAAVTAARDYNTALSACQSTSMSHLVAAAVVAVLGGLATALLAPRRRRPAPPAPPATPYLTDPLPWQWQDPTGPTDPN